LQDVAKRFESRGYDTRLETDQTGGKRTPHTFVLHQICIGR